MDTGLICSRSDSNGVICGAPLDHENYPRWCKSCLAAYKREYRERREAMTKGNGFALGVQAMREVLWTEFHRLGGSGITGAEAAALIRQAPGPQTED